jgi:hypothetical protein
MTTEQEIEASRKLDDVVMRVRDGGAPLTRPEAWALLTALAAGRVAIRERDVLRGAVARLTGQGQGANP